MRYLLVVVLLVISCVFLVVVDVLMIKKDVLK